ncbi:hypothetical protein OsJ_01896 [Oryza sativa Japonica Group]|uniref:Uncharacterized protein n=1 Tax=Oryza sativa subsp. japonica TaxID=39947 RepID=A2ZTG7_ORYSJ|nr:hypothetical protein OsJ_01896 [Oryza sativa Japonica Group]
MGNPTLTERVVATEGETEALGEKVAELTSSHNNILGTLRGLESWIPNVDAGMWDLNKTVEGISTRITALESQPKASPTAATPPPEGQGKVENHQGLATDASAAQEHTLVKGLKGEIKFAIKLHKPRIVDAALSLAKIQEELIAEAGKKNFYVSTRGSFKEANTAPGKIGYQGKGILGPVLEETKKVEEKPKWEDRFESLKAARRARESASSVEKSLDLVISAQNQYNSTFWRSCWRCSNFKLMENQ